MRGWIHDFFKIDRCFWGILPILDLPNISRNSLSSTNMISNHVGFSRMFAHFGYQKHAEHHVDGSHGSVSQQPFLAFSMSRFIFVSPLSAMPFCCDGEALELLHYHVYRASFFCPALSKTCSPLSTPPHHPPLPPPLPQHNSHLPAPPFSYSEDSEVPAVATKYLTAISRRSSSIFRSPWRYNVVSLAPSISPVLPSSSYHFGAIFLYCRPTR